MVLVSVGAVPRTDLASSSGIETGIKGAFKVNRRMETSVLHVFAAGDCVETWRRLLNRYTYLPLGTTAHKQGRIPGENAIGGGRAFAGSLGTQVVKVFDLVVARTGLNDAEARQAGLDSLTVEEKVWDHKVYYPGAKHLHIQVCGDRRTGTLLGTQMAGHIDAEVSKRVDIFASALFHGILVEELNDLDLSYTPPLSAPWDAVQAAAQAWNRAARQSCA